MTNLRTSQNYVSPVGEKDFGPSQTQPNDVMSVRDILEKFARGLPISAGDIGFYDDPDDLDMSDFDAMDPFEKEMFIREQREYVKELEERVKDEQKEQPEQETQSGKQQRPQAKSESAASQATQSDGQQDD